jgi:hypothetical protein
MYVNDNVVDELCTDCEIIGRRLQQERSSDVLLPKLCSSRNSPSLSYSQVTRSVSNGPVPYSVTIREGSAESQTRCTIHVRQPVVRIDCINQRQVSPAPGHSPIDPRELCVFTKATFHYAGAGPRVTVPITLRFGVREADWH